MEAEGLIPILVEVQEAAVGLKPWDWQVSANVALNVALNVAPKDLYHRSLM